MRVLHVLVLAILNEVAFCFTCLPPLVVKGRAAVRPNGFLSSNTFSTSMRAHTACEAPLCTRKQKKGRLSKGLGGFALGLVAHSRRALADSAVAAASSQHLHIGQKVANFFRSGGLPDDLVLMLISAMPVVELRGGIPVGLWMGLPLSKVFGLCILGNMIPIPFILLGLRSKTIQDLAKPVLDRARKKASEFGDASSQALALTLFVGIPLPGTGAWTGAMGAFLLGMSFRSAMLSIFLGVVAAGSIMSALTLAGKAGALFATAVLAVFCVSNIIGGGSNKKATPLK